MNLQNQPVVDAHPCHFGQHLPAKCVRLIWCRAAGAQIVKQSRGLGLWHILGTCARVTVIGAGGAVRFEKCAPHPMRLKIALPVAGVAVCQSAQFFNIGYKAFKLWVYYIVRAVSCDNFARPSGFLDHFVPVQIIQRVFRCRYGLNVEPLKQRPRPEIGPRKAIGDVIIGFVSSVWTKTFGDAENRFKGMVDPHPAGGSTQQMKILSKHSPDFSSIGFCRATIATRHAQIGQVDTLRKQHSKHVVVRCDEQLCRVWKCLVFSKPARVSVTMWANQRQVFYLCE